MLRNEAKQLCTSCHEPERLAQATVVHGGHPPFEAGACVACHNPHASDNDLLLRLPRPELCRTCHAGR